MDRTRAISKTMLSYLKRAREHKEFMVSEVKEFERGKRHLANIMGYDPDRMNQNNIDEAIRYLFPSSLFDPKARPMMKSPDQVYAAKKDAQFDVEGRPFHHLFYTVTPIYYSLLNDIACSYKMLNDHEDAQLARGVLQPPKDSQYVGLGRQWIGKEECEDKFLEQIKQHDYDHLIKSLTKLRDHPYSNMLKDMFDSMSKELIGQSISLKLPELKKDPETGHIYTEMDVPQRAHLIRVKTILNGSGIVNVEKEYDILYFKTNHLRRAILFPLTLSNMLDKVDVYAEVVRRPQIIGQTTIAMAMRYAMSCSIAAFKDPETRERLRLAGLLTHDTRVKERKKFGQEGARAKYTWRKR